MKTQAELPLPLPETETVACYGAELVALVKRLDAEGRYVAMLTCDRRHYLATVRHKARTQGTNPL